MSHNLLKVERRLRGWSQAKVAEVLGVSTKTVTRWELGTAVPYPYYRGQLAALFGKTAQQLGLFKDTDKMSVQTEELESMPLANFFSAATPISLQADPSIPQVLNNSTRLLGRQDLSKKIKERLFATEHRTFTAVHGLPGIGKTMLVAALATDEQVRAHFPDGILWAELGRYPNVLNEFVRWGQLLGVVPNQAEAIKKRAFWEQALRAAIGSRRLLLILDDARTVEAVQAFQIGGPRCSYLLTTRQSQIARTFDRLGAITVPELEEADRLVLLARYVPRLVERDPQGAQALVQATGGLPLAITLMGKYLASSTLATHP